MSSNSTLVIIGAGLAGAKAAEAARESGFDGRIRLVGAETHRPYERPPLSKAVLRGEADPDTAHVHDATYYDVHDIELVEAQVSALDIHAFRLQLADGATMAFDRAIIATGASPRKLRIPGADLHGVHYLRTIDDSLRLRDAIRDAGRVAVIGAGWIGTEVAASARLMGAEVVMIDPQPVPLAHSLGVTVGAVFRDLHADNRVELRLGVGARELRGDTSVRQVVLDDGIVEDADVVVVGIGVEPRIDLAAGAGHIVVDNGIRVDEFLETAVPGIYAAGDVANARHPTLGQDLRVEHWANALNQGLAAGRNAVGTRTPYDRLPYFYSDQFDLGIEYVGHAAPTDDIAIRGDLPGREFLALWHRDGIPTAAMAANVWDTVDELKGLISAREPVDLTRFENVDMPLSGLGHTVGG